LGSVAALLDPQLWLGCPVPEGFLAALTAPLGTVKRFWRASDCADGAVGLSAQAASAARVKRRGNGFI